MTVSSNEVNDVVRLTQQVDPKAFINVYDLRQVLVNFTYHQLNKECEH